MTATTDLASALRFNSVKFRLDVGQELSGTASGRILAADLRPARWVAQVSTAQLTHAQLAGIQALIEQLDGARGTFLLWDAAKLYPAADPTGSIVGSNAVQIKSVGSNGKSFALKSLPSAYVLSRGDLVQVTYAAGRIALHRVVAPITADGFGDTAEFEVRPHLVVGMAVNDFVNLKKPAAEFIMVPGSYDPDAALVTGTVSFQAVQKL